MVSSKQKAKQHFSVSEIFSLKQSILFFRQTWNFFERIAEECAFVVEATNDRRGMDIVDDIVEKPFNPS